MGDLLFQGSPPSLSQSAANEHKELHANRIKAPSEMIAIADGGATGKLDFGIQGFRGVIPGDALSVGKIHGGGANVLFCDGHVQWCRREDVTLTKAAPLDESAYHREQPIVRLWNNDHSDSRS